MHIVLVEGNYHERCFAMNDLGIAFPKAQIQSFACIGSFLLKSNELPPEYIMVIEHHLPLMQVEESDEEMRSKYAYLVARFPWIGESWNHEDGGEKLIRHIHSMNPNIPILIYTHSIENDIAGNVISDPKVRYLVKMAKNESERLKAIIRSF